jgi:hypothetical protein
LIAIYLYISINLQEDEKGMEFLMVVTKSKWAQKQIVLNKHVLKYNLMETLQRCAWRKQFTAIGKLYSRNQTNQLQRWFTY